METSEAINWTRALQGLSKEEVARVEGTLSRRNFASHAPIFLQGESADAVYVVRSGRVRLIRRNSAGEEFTTGVWSEGYLIGLISAFVGTRRFLAAETLEPVVLDVLHRTALHACMEEIPRFALNIANLLAMLASDSIQRSAPLALEPVEAKLGRVLVKLAVLDETGTMHVVKGISQDELGSMVGASRPWVNRALAGFEKRGLISRHKPLVIAIDIAACRKLWID